MRSNPIAIGPAIVASVTLAVGYATGCASASKDFHETDGPFAATVILPAAKLDDRYFPNSVRHPLWTPDTNDVAQAMNDLPDYFRRATNGPLAHPQYASELPGIRQNLNQTGCQIIGVILNEKRGILLNCFPYEKSVRPDNWKKQFVRVYDGGPRYWSVVYLLDQRSFTNLHIDLGY